MALPSVPTNPTPSDRARGVSTRPTLTWNAPGATACGVYLGLQVHTFLSQIAAEDLVFSGVGHLVTGTLFTFDRNDDGSPGGLMASAAETLSGQLTLTAFRTFAWRVYAYNADGVTPGPLWFFETGALTLPPDAPATPPATPSAPTPSHVGFGSLTPTLSWTATGATSYDVYFGTSASPPLVSAGQAGATYVPAGPLVDTTVYYWKIVAINAYGSTTGAVWSFTASVEDSVTTFTSTTTGTIANFNFGTLTNFNVLRMNNATLTTIQGLTSNGAAPADGTVLWIESVGAGQVDVANQHATPTAAHRIINNVTASISLAPGSGRAMLIYDGTTARWRVIEHEQGNWIAVLFSAGNFTSQSATWTVASGDVFLFRYWLKGTTLIVVLELVSTTLSALSASLDVTIPGGLLAKSTAQYWAAGQCFDNGGALEPCIGSIVSGLDKIAFRRNAGANWSASTDATNLFTTSTFEVQ